MALLSPAEGSTLSAGVPALLTGRATDPQHPELACDFRWESDVSGVVAEGVAGPSGEIVSEVTNLLPGPQVLRLRARDVDGWVGEARVHIDVMATARPQVRLRGPSEPWPLDLPVPVEGEVVDADARRPPDVVIGGGDLPAELRVRPEPSGHFAALVPGLGAGLQVLTATVTDLDGLGAADSVAMTLVDCPDADGDGFRSCQGDCADLDASVHPGAWVQPGDGVDQDCDGSDEPPFDASASGVTVTTADPGSNLGTALSSLEDLDGDGLPELVVASPAASPGGLDYAGAVLVFRSTTLLEASSGEVSDAQADAVLQGEAHTDGAGWRVCPLGDLDGDGLPELATAAPLAQDGAGRVYVVQGSLLRDGGEHRLDEAMAVLEGAWEDDALGFMALFSADIDGDGLPELFVSALISPNRPDESVDTLGYLNGSDGVLAFRGADLAGGGSWVPDDAFTVSAGFDDAAWDAAVAVGDVDGDGTADLALGAARLGPTYRGNAVVYSGAAMAGRPTSKSADADLLLHGDYDGQVLGAAFAAAGDLDGDGLGDLWVASTSEYGGVSAPGRVHLVPGSAVVAGGEHRVSEVATAEVLGEHWTDRLGSFAPRPANLDGDGIPDLLLGAPGHSSLADIAGRVYGLSGYRILGGTGSTLDAPSLRIDGADEGDALGGPTAVLAMDLDGDGWDEVVLGCPDCGPGYDGDGEWVRIAWVGW